MDLVEAARNGREADLLRLFDEHHAPLFRFAFRLTGSVSDAEDVVQECFLGLLRPQSSYDPARAPLRTYLFGVVRNLSLKLRMARGPDCDSDFVAQSDPSQESHLLQVELAETVSLAISQLPEGQREVLLLAHYEYLSLAEIASVLEVEVTTVKSRLQRARAQLKLTLSNHAQGAERRR